MVTKNLDFVSKNIRSKLVLHFFYYIYRFLEFETRKTKNYNFFGAKIVKLTFFNYKVSDFVSDLGKNVPTCFKECYLLSSFKGITFFSLLRV